MNFVINRQLVKLAVGELTSKKAVGANATIYSRHRQKNDMRVYEVLYNIEYNKKR